MLSVNQRDDYTSTSLSTI